MSQTRDQKRFTISEVAADWHELMIPQRTVRPSIAHVSEQLDPRFAASRHTTSPISHTRPSPCSLYYYTMVVNVLCILSIFFRVFLPFAVCVCHADIKDAHLGPTQFSSVQFSMIVYIRPILIASSYHERASSRHMPC